MTTRESNRIFPAELNLAARIGIGAEHGITETETTVAIDAQWFYERPETPRRRAVLVCGRSPIALVFLSHSSPKHIWRFECAYGTGTANTLEAAQETTVALIRRELERRHAESPGETPTPGI